MTEYMGEKADNIGDVTALILPFIPFLSLIPCYHTKYFIQEDLN